ncbi:MAG: TIGR02678 family protein, partial [Thermoleophilaceae bacterium]
GLVRAVADAGARCEPPLALDFERRAERIAFADALDLLCAWGVLRLDDGARASFSRREQGEDEALFTIDRKRLASLLRDSARVLAAGTVADLLDDVGEYAPTDEGRARRLRHRLARRLAEDPVLYVDELSDEERAYFHRQRAYLEERVAAATGLVPERRAEGTACIEGERWLTDLPFPARSARKQAALLLCDELARRLALGEAELDRAELRAWARGLLQRHGESLGRSPDDPVDVDELVADALEVLVGIGAAAPTSAGGGRALPLCARFREPELRVAGEAGRSPAGHARPEAESQHQDAGLDAPRR